MSRCFCTCVGVSMCLCALPSWCVCVCQFVWVRKKSDGEVSVGGAEALWGLVGVRCFVDNKYLKGRRPSEVTESPRRGEQTSALTLFAKDKLNWAKNMDSPRNTWFESFSPASSVALIRMGEVSLQFGRSTAFVKKGIFLENNALYRHSCSMNPINIGDLMAFPIAPPIGQLFNSSRENGTVLETDMK